jgi:hypothetical protein
MLINFILAVLLILIEIQLLVDNTRLRQENEDLKTFIHNHTTILFDVIDEVVKHCFNKVAEKGKKK